MNVKNGTEAEQFPEKEYINGIFVAVYPLFQIRICSVLLSFFFSQNPDLPKVVQIHNTWSNMYSKYIITFCINFFAPGTAHAVLKYIVFRSTGEP